MNIARTIVKSFLEAYMYAFGSRIAAHKLKHLADKSGNDIEQLVHLTFSFEYKPKVRESWVVSIKPLQVRTEVAELCRLVQELKPERIVEIGSASGGMLFLFGHVVNPEKIVSVDLPRGGFGGGYPFWEVPFFRSFGKRGVIQLIRADSHSEETLEKLKGHLNNSEVDFLFLDGDHTYQGVKQDFQMYSPLVRKGGIVAFHDIVTHDPTVGCEVDRFWNEVKQSYCYSEIVESQNQKWAGIGVLYL